MAEWDYYDEGAAALPKHIAPAGVPRQRSSEPVLTADVSLAEVLAPAPEEDMRPAGHRGRRRMRRRYVPRHAAPPS